jgi:hypothetical protein
VDFGRNLRLIGEDQTQNARGGEGKKTDRADRLDYIQGSKDRGNRLIAVWIDMRHFGILRNSFVVRDRSATLPGVKIVRLQVLDKEYSMVLARPKSNVT